MIFRSILGVSFLVKTAVAPALYLFCMWETRSFIPLKPRPIPYLRCFSVLVMALVMYNDWGGLARTEVYVWLRKLRLDNWLLELFL